MYHIRQYNNANDYCNGMELIPPYIACIKGSDEVVYSSDSPNYAEQYFTICSLENGTYVTILSNDNDVNKDLQYSTDDGKTWQSYVIPNKGIDGEKLYINRGERILFKGNNPKGFSNEVKYTGVVSSARVISFAGEGRYAAYGNVNSLVCGDDFNTENITIPSYAYSNLFYNAKALVYAHHLYIGITVGTGSYIGMFSSCKSLISAPSLPATTLGDWCYQNMFNGCTSLVYAPELPATTLGGWCYQSMFHGCKSLVNAPELPATVLRRDCYSNMFNGCTSLVNAPKLPATTLEVSCYSNMFNDCTSLVNAPELPATTLLTSCYNYMFNGCTKLNHVKAMFTTTPSTTYTTGWLKGVSPTGTFVKNAAATWDVRGTSGIPEGWTVETATA